MRRFTGLSLLPLMLALAIAPVEARQAATSSAPAAPPKVRSEMLVSTKWLAEHLKDPKVVVLHIADSFADYKRGHIPGARFLATAKFIDNTGAIGTELPSVEQLTKAFGDLGVGEGTRVVLYATNWGPNAARGFFTLDYLGHGDRAALLDGGVEQWLAEDRPVSGETPTFKPTSFTAHLQPGVRALLDEVKKAVDARPGEEPAQLVDTRPARRYQAGHLGGATHLYWQDTLVSEENPVFLPPEKLRDLYASRGLVSGKKVLTYCEVGLQASHGYFLARYLGYEAAMYDGSFQEWSVKNLPIVKGAAKR